MAGEERGVCRGGPPWRLRAILCLIVGHRWRFHHEARPPAVVCDRCLRIDPMPYGDGRLPYL
jgi:hypothetical protein